MAKIHTIFFSGFFFFLSMHSFSQDLDSFNLPIVKINTFGFEIPNEPKIKATMDIINYGPQILNHVSDSVNDYHGYIGIELHGSSSLMFPKNSFGIEIRTPYGADTTASVLGMPEESDWVLYGPYTDKTMLRNVLEYNLSRDMGRYAPRTVCCELVLNESYWGVYVMMEKIKRDKNRVDISKLTPDENSGNDLTGGYIIKLDKYDGSNSGLGWTSPYTPPNASSADQSIFIQYEYPKNQDITSSQMEYIREYVTAFEAALNSRDYNNIITGYQRFADVNSMVDYFILNEISHNVDGYRLSTFIYKDKDSKNGRLTFGPIWDLNLGFGNADYCEGGKTNGWAFLFNYVCNTDYWQIPFWWNKLFADYKFRQLLSDRWNTLRQGPFKTQTVLNYIDSMASVLNEAQTRNYVRWSGVLGYYIWPNAYVGATYGDEINYLKDWITSRFEWMDENLANAPNSLEEDNLNPGIVVYPNPFQNQINIVLPDTKVASYTLVISDISGKTFWSHDYTLTGHSNLLIVSGSGPSGTELNNGIYILRLYKDHQIFYTTKIVKNG